ncbi:MAG: nitrilase-related carbon-nitrogen hydrolase [Crocinitomicaceae bacterium]
MTNLKIAGIQFNIVWENKEANFSKLETDFLLRIKPDDLDCIILPEMFATGFTMKPSSFWEDDQGVTFQWLKKWAKKLNTSFGAGVITKSETGKYQNTFVMVNPSGNIEYYNKRHLFRMGSENEHYVAGLNPTIVSIKGWKINLQVCYDLRFPVFARNTMSDGNPLYDAMIYIANWPEARAYAWQNLLQARAIENQAYVIGVNRVGEDGNGIKHSGDSAIYGPLGQLKHEILTGHEKIIYCELNKNKLLRARETFPVLLDADQFRIANQ